MKVSAYEVLRELEERMRIERFYPPDWKGLEGSDTALLVKVLVEHVNRAMADALREAMALLRIQP